MLTKTGMPLWMSACALFFILAVPRPQEPNALSSEEKEQGFELLFDGKTFDGWRGYRKDHVPAAWKIEDGAMALTAQGEGGDLATEQEFADFELRLEWKISPGGNSGIFFRADEDVQWAYLSAPEMQVLDNAGHPDGKSPLTSAGSNYALHAPSRDVTRPVGEWNSIRIIAEGDHVEHWMNGVKIVEYTLWDEAWGKLVQNSKFASMPGYGRNKSGKIVLQDHGNKVWYRGVKIRRL